MAHNKYVSFVPDKVFLSCIGKVCNAYANVKTLTDKDLNKNVIDPFKLIFDLLNKDITLIRWKQEEKLRQADKTINNEIGYFHQHLLGSVKGWEDLNIGGEADIKKKDNSIFIQLKNKFNGVNADSLKNTKLRLFELSKRYPNANMYLAFLIGRSGSSGERPLKINGKIYPNIKEVWGKKVYELVTGTQDSLEEVWVALPVALNFVLAKNRKISKMEKVELVEYFKKAFK